MSFTKKKLLAVPALYPDVAIIHVHAADIYGNAHIRGILVSDVDIARANKETYNNNWRTCARRIF